MSEFFADKEVGGAGGDVKGIGDSTKVGGFDVKEVELNLMLRSQLRSKSLEFLPMHCVLVCQAAPCKPRIWCWKAPPTSFLASLSPILDPVS